MFCLRVVGATLRVPASDRLLLLYLTSQQTQAHVDIILTDNVINSKQAAHCSVLILKT